MKIIEAKTYKILYIYTLTNDTQFLSENDSLVGSHTQFQTSLSEDSHDNHLPEWVYMFLGGQCLQVTDIVNDHGEFPVHNLMIRFFVFFNIQNFILKNKSDIECYEGKLICR